MSDKKFDFVIYGASGFTGRLVAEYVQATYGNGKDISWAIAGRNGNKLAEVAQSIGLPDNTAKLVADADDPASLNAMLAQTNAVITTVGPYQLYGSNLVAACAAQGVHYVDLTGEPNWMHEMIGAYERTAKQSGARIVFSCGFDSIPFDLGVLFLQNAIRETYGKAAQRVKCRVCAMNGEFSGGTVASLGATMAALGKNPDLISVLANPFSLAGKDGPPQPDMDTPQQEEALAGAWLAPFIMAPINTKNIHRSNALMDYAYGADFIYDEMMVTGMGDEGKAMATFLAANSPLAGEDLPKPGEGPSAESRAAGNYDILFIGETDDGDMRARVTGDMDPGYGSTSKMLAEACICLVKDCPDLAGGIYTSAPALGETLIKRLTAHAGLSFRLE